MLHAQRLKFDATITTVNESHYTPYNHTVRRCNPGTQTSQPLRTMYGWTWTTLRIILSLIFIASVLACSELITLYRHHVNKTSHASTSFGNLVKRGPPRRGVGGFQFSIIYWNINKRYTNTFNGDLNRSMSFQLRVLFRIVITYFIFLIWIFV